MSDIMNEFTWLNGQPISQGKIKVVPQDFVVKEVLGFDFTGEGEHFMVRIRKTGENTKYVVNELAKACGVKSKNASWAGLKDRHAVTEQWLSIHLPGQDDPDLTNFVATHPEVEILATTRHNKKLRPGDLQGNEFELRLTEVSDVEDVVARLEKIAGSGLPNYFGAQRFGHAGNNVTEARRWGRDNVRTRDNNKRSFYLSAARSWIFNHVLSKRLEQGTASTALVGDLLLDGNERLVEVTTENQADLQVQLAQGSMQLTGPLAGDNELTTNGDVEALEQAIVDSEPELMKLIRGNRMRQERRSLTLIPQQLTWDVEGNSITLKFALPAGCFATAIVRELIEEQAVEPHYAQ